MNNAVTNQEHRRPISYTLGSIRATVVVGSSDPRNLPEDSHQDPIREDFTKNTGDAIIKTDDRNGSTVDKTISSGRSSTERE